MIYEFDKRGYKYNIYSQTLTLLGYFIDVYRLNDNNIKEEEKKAMLNDFRDSEYFKLERKQYFAYVFYKDKIDGNEKLRNYLMDIIFYLTKNYSSENCEKMEDFFQNESGYYLIMESLNYGKPSEDISNPKIIKTCFDQINQELEKRHKFGLYDSLFDISDLGFIPTENKIRVALKFQTFLGELDFRYRGTVFNISEDLKEEKLLDPELTEKYYGLKKSGNIKKYIQEFENIAYNINSKNELFNIGIMMLKFIKSDINQSKDDNLKGLIISLINKKSKERLSLEEYVNHSFFKNNSESDHIDSYKYEELANLEIRYEEITNIIILKNNFILCRKKRSSLYLIVQYKNCVHIRDDFEGSNLFNLDDMILIDDRKKNKINLYKLKENVNSEKLIKERRIQLKEIIENVQTIDILYKQILPLSKDNNNLIIVTKEGKVTL